MSHSSSESSNSSSDENETKAVAKREQKTDLFTKKGVPLFEQQMIIKDEFKRQAKIIDSSDSDDLLVKKKV